MWEQISPLFEGLGIIPIIILIAGIIFCIIEIFVPGFGIFGIIGSAFIVISVVIRIILGITEEQIPSLVFMLMIVVTVIIGCVLIMIFAAKHGLLGRSPFVENRTSISVDYGKKDEKEMLKLIDKVGFAVTDFVPSGRFILNEQTFDAVSQSEFIKKGDKVKIVDFKDNMIFVKKV
jgi:membrane-bound serine protease (ClpP class)